MKTLLLIVLIFASLITFIALAIAGLMFLLGVAVRWLVKACLAAL